MLAILAAVGVALSVGTMQPERCSVNLHAEVATVTAGQPFWVALQFEIEPGWHIYWTNPGDSGLPTEIRWKLPPGFRVSEVRWPTPHRFEAGGLVSYGFEGAPIVLARIVPPERLDQASPTAIGVETDWMVCNENCELGSSNAGLEWGRAPATAKLFETARAALPRPGTALNARAVRTEKGCRLQFHLQGKPEVAGATFFAAASGLVSPSAAQQVKREAGTYELSLETLPGAKQPGSLDGVLTVSFANKTTESYWIKAPFSLEGGKE
ncbi:MAG: hypothetical protein H6534_05670 [Chthonomonadaceae bacterium]|nr:hypothetical protein [Chthonomonadaceae bacterium]